MEINIDNNASNRVERRQIDLDNVLNSRHDTLYLTRVNEDHNENMNTLLDDEDGVKGDETYSINDNNIEKFDTNEKQIKEKKSLICFFTPSIKNLAIECEINLLFKSFISPYDRVIKFSLILFNLLLQLNYYYY